MATLSFILVGAVLRAAEADPNEHGWTQFRGPNATGVASAGKYPLEFGPGKNVRWQAETPPGHSSPVIWDDAVFLTGARGKQMITLCLDRRTGKPRWEQTVTVEALEKVHKVNSHASPTPVTDGKALFVYFASFGLLAYDFTGRELWRKPLPTPAIFYKQGTATSPILADGKLILFLQVGNDSCLLALDPANGSEIWKASVPNQNNTYSTPVTWKEAGRTLVGLSCAKQFTAYDLADGKAAWWVSDLGYAACSTPIVVGDRLIISTAGVQGEPANMTVPPTFDEAVKKWSQEGEPLISFDAIPDDFLYTDRKVSGGVGNTSLKRALDAKKGAKINREEWDTLLGELTAYVAAPRIQAVVVCVRTGGKDDVTRRF